MEETPEARTMRLLQYFHGYLPRSEAEEMLCNCGDFLVRETCVDKRVATVISVKWGCDHRHFRLQMDNRAYVSVDGDLCFQTVAELIAHYVERRQALTSYSKACLLTPIGPQRWEIGDDEFAWNPNHFLGKGQFGKVYIATMKKRKVALKTCGEKKDHLAKLEFLREARIMRHLKPHPNVVEFIGISVLEAPLKMLIGLADFGSLPNFLRTRKDSDNKLTQGDKVKLSLDAARGLKSIADQNIIHMDVGARNCVVTKGEFGETFRLQISDFGLSRKGPEYQLQSGDVLSQRWAAPEVLAFEKASFKSDVWSFAVLMWEIFTDAAEEPYAGVDPVVLLHYLEEKRMRIPSSAPAQLHPLILKCWDSDPEKRPSFAECRRAIEECYDMYDPFTDND